MQFGPILLDFPCSYFLTWKGAPVHRHQNVYNTWPMQIFFFGLLNGGMAQFHRIQHVNLPPPPTRNTPVSHCAYSPFEITVSMIAIWMEPEWVCQLRNRYLTDFNSLWRHSVGIPDSPPPPTSWTRKYLFAWQLLISYLPPPPPLLPSPTPKKVPRPILTKIAVLQMNRHF